MRSDASAIEAITCVDYVQVGEFKARVPFGCFLDTNTPMLKNVDGVAGFGIPKLGARGETLPMPLLWALTDPKNSDSNAKRLERKFTFFSSEDSAELQLGGFDPECVVGGQVAFLYLLEKCESSAKDGMVQRCSLTDETGPIALCRRIRRRHHLRAGASLHLLCTHACTSSFS